MSEPRKGTVLETFRDAGILLVLLILVASVRIESDPEPSVSRSPSPERVVPEAYPGVDEVLISWVPAFARLRNPILRKTVAKVATLEQAARIGNVGVRDMVRKLREATGQSPVDAAESPEPETSERPASESPPWVKNGTVRATFDADSLIESGEHPIGKVRQSVADTDFGGMVRLTSTFRPEPLLDAMRRNGLAVYSEESSPGRHVTYFSRPSGD